MSTCRLHPRGPRPDPVLLEQRPDLPTSVLFGSKERAGGVRDAEGVVAKPFPVFALGVNHLGPYKDGPGEVQVGAEVAR